MARVMVAVRGRPDSAHEAAKAEGEAAGAHEAHDGGDRLHVAKDEDKVETQDERLLRDRVERLDSARTLDRKSVV